MSLQIPARRPPCQTERARPTRSLAHGPADKDGSALHKTVCPGKVASAYLAQSPPGRFLFVRQFRSALASTVAHHFLETFHLSLLPLCPSPQSVPAHLSTPPASPA